MAADKKTLLRDALKQVQAGKIDKAIETYRAAVKLDPRDAAVRNSLADLLGRQGKKRDAIAEYLEASALYEKDGFGPRAIAICQKIVKLDPEQWGVRLKLGDLYAAQKLQAEARTIYLQLAERHDRRGEVAPALEIFRRIADLDPANIPARVKLAEMFEKQKRADEAAAEYVRAAKGYAALKEQDQAAQLLVRAFKLSPANLEARLLLADFYAQRQEWQVVVGLLETPVARGTQDTGVIVPYAEALTRVGHAREAAGLLEKLQASEPNAVPVNLALGRAYLKVGELEKGAAALNRCVGAHLAENRLDLADALLRELAAAAPEDDRVLQRIVEVAHKRGDAEEAAAAYLRLAEVYEGKGLVRNAVGALERYLEGRPGDAAATVRLERLKATAHPAHPPPAGVPAPPAPAHEAAPPPAPAGAPAKATAMPRPAVEPAAPGPPAPAALPPGLAEEIEIDLEEGEDLSALMAEGEEELVVADEGDLAVAGGEELVAEGAEEIPELAGEPAGGEALPELEDAAAEEVVEILLEDDGPTEPISRPELPPAPYGETPTQAAAPPPAPDAAPGVDYGDISLPETLEAEEAGDQTVPEEPPATEPAAPAEPALESFDSAFVAVDPAEGAAAAPAPAPAGGAGGDFEDLLGDLRQEIESGGELVPPPLEAAGLHEIFQEFQRSVREQLGDEDFDTHYNLGIAYKEMGLTEEAIGEFALAEKSPTRRLDALSMMALCLREQGRLDEAAQKLRTGVALAVEGSGQQKGFLYDLAALHEQAGRADQARESLQRIQAMDPEYRDVAARLGAGEQPPGPPRRKSKISYL